MAKDRDHKKELLVITRRLDTPRNLVFTAFTDPEHLMRWWGPKDFNMVYCKLDLRPGGMVHYCARSLDGKLLWGRFEYREILAAQRIIFIYSFEDGYGEILHKVILTEKDGKTIIEVNSEAMDNFGFSDMFDLLENYLFTLTEKIIQHE